ncbi:hypothetical protein K0M31_001791 [Melipona bicolor]|uniref:Uncharacterized protein n=1 Tax=Melipona bicolor TaxID=60889 RepID=A0AA40GG80_9HYME|nr:hypothetical protein K0M31_001791 [Melipona bicolor]
MSNEQNSCWKFNRNTDKASCARASCQEQTKEGHSSKTTDKIHNVFGREPIKNWSKNYLQGSIVEAEKYSESVAERDSQRNSSWQTVELSHNSFFSRSNEATSGRNIQAEAGNFSWRRGNAIEQRNSQTVWDLKTTFPEACENKRLLGINENLPEDLKERYFWKPRESWGISQKMYENSKKRSQSIDTGSPVGAAGSQVSYRMVKNRENYSWRLETSSPLDRTPTFANLALDVSYAGLDTSGFLDIETSWKSEDDMPEYWEDLSVVECLSDKSSSYDESTPEERVQALKEVLAETDIHEGDGIVSDFLFHVARTKYGKIYIRVIRTLLLNRGRIYMIYAIDRIGLAIRNRM